MGKLPVVYAVVTAKEIGYMKIKLLFALMLIGSASMAQRSDNYWVVETNKFKKGKSIVRIYDNANVLLHEKILNRDIDVQRNRDKKFLNRMVSDYFKGNAIAQSPANRQAGNKRLRRG